MTVSASPAGDEIDHPGNGGIRVGLAGSSIWIVLTVFFIASLMLSLQYPIGGLKQPGAGLWPAAVSAIGVACSLLLVFRPGEAPQGIERANLTATVGFVAALVAFWLLHPLITFVPAAFVFLLFVLRFSGRERWAVSGVGAALGSLGVYAGFGLALSVPI